MQPVDLIVEREHLPEALHAFLRHDKAAYDDCVKALRRDLLSEHRAGVEEKIARWIEVTRIARACNTRLVQFYMQAKLLYRDGYFEAAIMMCRSAAELICHELLQTVEHPFGDADKIARENFRKLARYLHKRTSALSKRHYELLNAVFTTGNSYVHPQRGTVAASGRGRQPAATRRMHLRAVCHAASAANPTSANAAHAKSTARPDEYEVNGQCACCQNREGSVIEAWPSKSRLNANWSRCSTIADAENPPWGGRAHARSLRYFAHEKHPLRTHWPATGLYGLRHAGARARAHVSPARPE